MRIIMKLLDLVFWVLIALIVGALSLIKLKTGT